MKIKSAFFVFCFCSFIACSQQKESEITAQTPQQINYKTEVVVPELNIPWGMAFLPDGSLLITEKAGELIHFKDNVKVTIGGLPTILARGQGGFLDIKLHPGYETNGWIYFSYASPEGEGDGANTAVMRAKLEGTKLVNNELLYKASPNSRKGQHFGSRLEFDNQGYLYFSIGDRGNRDENPQDISRDGGKVYRIHDDGRVPDDNPFIDEEGAKTAIYSYGHRNQQGMVKHPETGEIWAHEHGPQGGDEINIINSGKNYGWPIISYGINYSGTSFTDLTEKEGMEQPLFYWVPSIAPSGMDFVSSNIYPTWKGDLLVGSLKFQYLERLILKNNEVTKREKLFEGIGRVRNVKQAPDGYLYIAVEGEGILRIIPKK